LCGCDAHGGARQVMREASRLGGCPSLWPAYEEKREKVYWRGVSKSSPKNICQNRTFFKKYFLRAEVWVCVRSTLTSQHGVLRQVQR
jgi:hypothetical protein